MRHAESDAMKLEDLPQDALLRVFEHIPIDKRLHTVPLVNRLCLKLAVDCCKQRASPAFRQAVEAYCSAHGTPGCPVCGVQAFRAVCTRNLISNPFFKLKEQVRIFVRIGRANWAWNVAKSLIWTGWPPTFVFLLAGNQRQRQEASLGRQQGIRQIQCA